MDDGQDAPRYDDFALIFDMCSERNLMPASQYCRFGEADIKTSDKLAL
jgi:hypothetical protein